MRSETEIRALKDWYIEEEEGGHDPFDTPGWEPMEGICLWCIRLRILKWVLGELEIPDNGQSMANVGIYSVGGLISPPDEELCSQLPEDEKKK